MFSFFLAGSLFSVHFPLLCSDPDSLTLGLFHSKQASSVLLLRVTALTVFILQSLKLRLVEGIDLHQDLGRTPEPRWLMSCFESSLLFSCDDLFCTD